MELTGKIALITGASSGIGYAAALAFARRGVHIAVTARSLDRLDALVSAVGDLPSPHGQILPIAADVRDQSAVQGAVDAVVQRFGRLDILIANAGIGQRGSLIDSPLNDIEAVFRTNIDGVIYAVRAAVPHMRQAGGGHIAIISSVVANMITPYTAAYSASKSAVSSLARALRYELESDHIGVSDLLVGRTSTEFNARRLGASGYADRAPRLPMMTPEYVAERIVRAVEHGHGTVTLRLFDRAIVLINQFLPKLVARRALRQYKPS